MFFVKTDASKLVVAAVRSTEGKNCAFALIWIRFAAASARYMAAARSGR